MKKEIQNNETDDAQDDVIRLADNIARDFNNFITAILGHTKLAMANIAQASEAYQDLTDVETSADKGARLVRIMQLYCEKAPLRVQQGDISELISVHVNALKKSLPKTIICHLSVAEAFLYATVDEALFLEAMSCLITNAVEAVGELEKGRIEVAVFKLENEIYIEVSNNGEKLSDLAIQKACLPYFSQKKNHKGLGLTFADGVARCHNGRIEIESNSSETSFSFILPCSNG